MTRRFASQTRCTAAIVALVVTGCSFTTMETAPRRPRSETMPRCTGSVMPVIADGIGTVLYGALARSAVREARAERMWDDSFERMSAVVFGGLAVAAAASGLWGLQNRGRCGRARDAHEAWRLGVVGGQATGGGAP